MISCEVLRVGAAGVSAASYCGPSLAAPRSKLRSESHRCAEAAGEGGGEGRSAGNEPGALGDWQGMKAGGSPSWGVVLRTSLRTGLRRLRDAKAFQAHKPFSPSSTARGCCGVDFEGYVYVGCVPRSQRRKG